MGLCNDDSSSFSWLSNHGTILYTSVETFVHAAAFCVIGLLEVTVFAGEIRDSLI